MTNVEHRNVTPDPHLSEEALHFLAGSLNSSHEIHQLGTKLSSRCFRGSLGLLALVHTRASRGSRDDIRNDGLGCRRGAQNIATSSGQRLGILILSSPFLLACGCWLI